MDRRPEMNAFAKVAAFVPPSQLLRSALCMLCGAPTACAMPPMNVYPDKQSFLLTSPALIAGPPALYASAGDLPLSLAALASALVAYFSRNRGALLRFARAFRFPGL
jgi:hypothetical protein